ncbi:MAG TPA: LuxR C-terminal-related transcriptional regulator [Nitrospiria bacterium]|jgi:DNA-binding CsgD family transcriptional regulator
MTLPLQDLSHLTRHRSDPGIIIFNNQHQVTFANQIAWEIFNNENKRNGFCVPAPVLKICEELKRRQHQFAWNSCPDAVYLKKIIVLGCGQFSLRAFIIADQKKNHSAHYLLLIDKVSLRKKFKFEQVQLRFNLAPREYQVVKLLVNGLTNKEIGNDLEIAESTVKEYMNKIMRKLKVNTRAGVVSRVLQPKDGDSKSRMIESSKNLKPVQNQPT